MHYIEKAIRTKSGVLANCWVADRMETNLLFGGASGTPQPAVIYMKGWLNVEEFKAGSEPVSTQPIPVEIPDVSALSAYTDAMAQGIQAVLSNANFEDGIIKNT